MQPQRYLHRQNTPAAQVSRIIRIKSAQEDLELVTVNVLSNGDVNLPGKPLTEPSSPAAVPITDILMELHLMAVLT
jgi:hypothetical protein